MPVPTKRGLLQRLGLKASGPSPDDWVEVAEGHVESATGSHFAADLVQQLQQAGIEAQERPYVEPDAMRLTGGPSAESRVRFAVLVHRRDQDRARQVLRSDQPAAISEAELTRQAMAADDSQIPADERASDGNP